jgi:hypothetical protein
VSAFAFSSNGALGKHAGSFPNQSPATAGKFPNIRSMAAWYEFGIELAWIKTGIYGGEVGKSLYESELLIC